MDIKTKKKWNLNIEVGGVSPMEIMLFTKHLSVILKSGVTLVDGLEILTGHTKGKMKSVLAKILETVKSGESFHAALGAFPKYFTPIYVNMIESGEASGTLEANLKKLALQLKKSYLLRKKVKSAMIYPALIFVAVFGLGISVAIFVLPKILPLFKSLDVELPVTTRGLIYVAEIFQAHGITILLGIFFGFTFLLWLLKRNFVKPFTHRLILKLPVVSTIIRNINLQRFSYTFGSLLESGLTVDKSLRITAAATENRAYNHAISSFIPEVNSGNSLSSAIEKYPNLFPVIISKMIDVGEKTGNLDSNLKYLSGFYEDAVDNATKNLSTTLEPILLIFIGVIVGTVAISILGPIYQITGSLRQ